MQPALNPLTQDLANRTWALHPDRPVDPALLANAGVQGHRSFDAAAADAELQGVSQANFQTLVDNTGRPPGPATGLEWLRRGVLDTTEFGQLVREGHTKVKYIQKYLDALHPV